MASETSRYRDEESNIPEPSLAESEDLHTRSRASSLGGGSQNLPVWLQESSSRWRKVPLPIRKAVRNTAHCVKWIDQWTRGPKEAQKQEITPLFPLIQESPLWLVERSLPKRMYKIIALLLVYLAWALTFIFIIRSSASSGNIEGYGTPNSIWCGANSWNQGNECGLNGASCRPFTNSTFAFRCPGNCKSVQKLEKYPVGGQEIIYDTLVIGGAGNSSVDPIYRADSFICQAAIHAGVVSDTHGGCGVALLTGSQKDFPASRSHGIQSIAFEAEFPKSYTFLTDLSSDCGVVDNRWTLLGVTVFFTVIISLFVSSPSIFFYSIFSIIFTHVGFVSDPPNILNYSDLLSHLSGKFLPACFVAYVFYRYCIHRTLNGLTAQIEKTIFWLGACWFGALDNYTFSKIIPIQRLTSRDLAQPGAILALIIIIISILLIAIGQIYHLRLEHRLRQYVLIYSIFICILLLLMAIPNQNLRIHHYILAMLFLPGTSLQTRPSLIYQGLLIGLFLNGIARWGFDPIVQTSYALFGNGEIYNALPNITAVVLPLANPTTHVHLQQAIRFSWPPSPPPGYDGISILINDVERVRWYEGEGNASVTIHASLSSTTDSFSQEQQQQQQQQETEQKTEQDRERQRDNDMFFRFAYMLGSRAAPYTRAGTWWRNGSWSGIPEGRI